MDRRHLLKTLAFSSVGSVIATPAIMQLLASCSSEPHIKWTPQFLNNSQAFVIEQLVDLILPVSKTPGAIDVDTPKFLDLILKDVISFEKQEIFSKGAKLFEEKFTNMFHKDILKGTKDNFDVLLASYFKISKKKQQEVFEFITKVEQSKEVQNELYFIYKYLIFIRYYALLGFYTSKQIETEVFNYKPVPGSFEACIPVEDAVKSSL